MKRLGTILCLSLFALAGCTTTPESKSATPTLNEASAPAIDEIANANNAFGFDLYEEISGGDGNAFISPASISTALGLAYAGARGETAAEMASVFHFRPDQYDVHASLGKLHSDLQIDKPGRVVSINNAIWIDHKTVVEPDYSNLIEKYYGARERRVDFRTSEASRERARLEINAWVEEKTKDRIKDFLQPPDITRDTRMNLVNTIYFKADWADPFEKHATTDLPFFLSRGETADVPMMSQIGAYRHLSNSQFQALEIPYVHNEYSMIVFLPKADDGLRKFESGLSSKKVTNWINDLIMVDPQPISLRLPKTKFTQRYVLSKTLPDMGMPRASSDQADFNEMVDRSKQPPGDNLGFKVGAIIHKTFLEMDEKGTEAAAATSVGMIIITSGRSGPPPIEFHVDHPYFIVLRHNETGAILFMGRINDPR